MMIELLWTGLPFEGAPLCTYFLLHYVILAVAAFGMVVFSLLMQ
ncbi:hypothetical protein [Gloeobacter morelensis]|nr:hypothetical protein [Gloeobacter morelensis]